MGKGYWIFFSLLSSFSAGGQTTVDLVEKTIIIEGHEEEIFYYGFALGDKMIFSFEEINGQPIEEVEIIELPTSSKFKELNSNKVENKTIEITSTSIYKFRLSNSTRRSRVCKIKIQRIPISEGTKEFNSTVYWRTVQDTIYLPKEEIYLSQSDTIVQEIYSSSLSISSQTALNGNKNSQVIDFTLPENTISWSFYLATGVKGKLEYEAATKRFNQSQYKLALKNQTYTALAVLALTGVSFFDPIQNVDNVKYWFLSNENSVYNFISGQEFYQYRNGDVMSQAVQMKYPLKGKIYLALLNDNIIDLIQVIVKVVSISVEQKWDTRVIQLISVNQKEEPYLKD